MEVLLAGATAPEPLPVNDLVEADLWDQLPADMSDLLAFLPQADLYRARMRSNLPFIRPIPVSGEASGAVGNAWLRRLETIGIRLRLWLGGLARWLGGWQGRSGTHR